MPRAAWIFPALIPGATYRIHDETTINDEGGAQLRKEFTVKPGETLDLGDILIEKPSRRADYTGRDRPETLISLPQEFGLMRFRAKLGIRWSTPGQHWTRE